jgi:hypothetical protein
MHESIEIPCGLSDDELITEVTRLARSARETTASLVAHLAELDARRLYLGAGCSSLFAYCTDVLRLSEHEAYNRIEAARLARRFPRVLPMLAEGAVTLTAVRLLSPRLSEENHEELLAAATGQGKREVERLIAQRFPVPDGPSSIRKLPTFPPTTSPPLRDRAHLGMDALPASAAECAPEAAQAIESASACPQPSAALPIIATSAALPAISAYGYTKRPGQIQPLAADRYEFRFTGSGATRDKLQLATDLLRHAIPSGDMAEVIDHALTVLIEDLAKKKFAATPRPRPTKDAVAGTRHIPAHVKRAVWVRDGGRCGFVGKDSRRCRERGFLEFHHIRPYGVGGEATVENIQLRCRAHNAYESECFYGRRFVPVTTLEEGAELVPERVAAAHPSPLLRKDSLLI